MKNSRNEPCSCGSGKKSKNCCEQKKVNSDMKNKYFRWFIISAIVFFLSITMWGIIDHFSSEHPEMEAYKCDNPACTRIHYRPISDANSNNVQN